jgi:hypothetical protein
MDADSLRRQLDDLAEQVEGSGWQTKPEVEWNEAERRAYERWAAVQLEALVANPDKPIRFRIRTYEEGEEDRRTRLGAFLRPFTIHFDQVEHDEPA